MIGHNSYNIDYCWGLYELARICFCYVINGHQLINNQLGFSFAYAIHTGEFSEFVEESNEEPPLIQARCSPTRTAYEDNPLTRTDSINEEPIKEKEKLNKNMFYII